MIPLCNADAFQRLHTFTNSVDNERPKPVASSICWESDEQATLRITTRAISPELMKPPGQISIHGVGSVYVSTRGFDPSDIFQYHEIEEACSKVAECVRQGEDDLCMIYKDSVSVIADGMFQMVKCLDSVLKNRESDHAFEIAAEVTRNWHADTIFSPEQNASELAKKFLGTVVNVKGTCMHGILTDWFLEGKALPVGYSSKFLFGWFDADVNQGLKSSSDFLINTLIPESSKKRSSGEYIPLIETMSSSTIFNAFKAYSNHLMDSSNILNLKSFITGGEVIRKSKCEVNLRINGDMLDEAQAQRAASRKRVEAGQSAMDTFSAEMKKSLPNYYVAMQNFTNSIEKDWKPDVTIKNAFKLFDSVMNFASSLAEMKDNPPAVIKEGVSLVKDCVEFGNAFDDVDKVAKASIALTKEIESLVQAFDKLVPEYTLIMQYSQSIEKEVQFATSSNAQHIDVSSFGDIPLIKTSVFYTAQVTIKQVVRNMKLFFAALPTMKSPPPEKTQASADRMAEVLSLFLDEAEALVELYLVNTGLINELIRDEYHLITMINQYVSQKLLMKEVSDGLSSRVGYVFQAQLEMQLDRLYMIMQVMRLCDHVNYQLRLEANDRNCINLVPKSFQDGKSVDLGESISQFIANFRSMNVDSIKFAQHFDEKMQLRVGQNVDDIVKWDIQGKKVSLHLRADPSKTIRGATATNDPFTYIVTGPLLKAFAVVLYGIRNGDGELVPLNSVRVTFGTLVETTAYDTKSPFKNLQTKYARSGTNTFKVKSQALDNSGKVTDFCKLDLNSDDLNSPCDESFDIDWFSLSGVIAPAQGDVSLLSPFTQIIIDWGLDENKHLNFSSFSYLGVYFKGQGLRSRLSY